MRDFLMVVAVMSCAVPQTLWVATYLFRPWRSTPFGWVFLAKGLVLAALFDMILIEWLIWDIPRLAWAITLLVLSIPIWAYWLVTLRIDRYVPGKRVPAPGVASRQ